MMMMTPMMMTQEELLNISIGSLGDARRLLGMNSVQIKLDEPDLRGPQLLDLRVPVPHRHALVLAPSNTSGGQLDWQVVDDGSQGEEGTIG